MPHTATLNVSPASQLGVGEGAATARSEQRIGFRRHPGRTGLREPIASKRIFVTDQASPLGASLTALALAAANARLVEPNGDDRLRQRVGAARGHHIDAKGQ